jgi:hypothetical protein
MNSSDWTRRALESQGFIGWLRFDELGSVNSPVLREPGVYVVVQEEGSSPAFLDSNPGGRFKGKDPSVDAATLTERWVPGAEVVYIGKANDLRRRLGQLRRFGRGDPVGHWGGRLIWQLAHSTELLVAWLPTPDRDPRTVERELIEGFRSTFGTRPFANLAG